MAALGLRAHSLHLPIARVAIGHPDRQRREECRQLMVAALDLAAAWHAGIAVLHVNAGIADLPPAARDESRKASIDLVHQLAERSEALGIRLALENLPVEAGKEERFGSSLRELAVEFPEPQIGFCLDTGHALCNREDMGAEIEAAGARLVSVHVSDNDGSGDLHWPPGHGILDLEAMERGFAAVGYHGRLVLELLRDAAGNPSDIVLKEAIDCLGSP